jgi:hypothetical protein
VSSFDGADCTTFLAPAAGALDHDVGAHLVPLQLGRVLDRGQADLLAVDDQRAALDLDVAAEAAVHRVVLQHVGQVVGLEEVVDRDDLDLGEVLRDSAEHHAADAAETVDANLDSHVLSPSKNRFAGYLPRTFLTVATTFSAVKPNSLNS